MAFHPLRDTNCSDPISIPCNVCGHRDVFRLANREYRGMLLSTVICRQCGLVWADPFPYNPRKYYRDEYRLAYKGTRSPKLKHTYRAGKAALSRLRAIERFLGESKVVLDVGSGGGEFAYLLRMRGHEVMGVEPNPDYADYSIRHFGLDVYAGFIQDGDFSPEPAFDAVTIWHVLEHTGDPCGVLEKVHSLLKPNGILVVEVPNIEATCQSPRRRFHEAHLFHFNLESLRRLAEKAGFAEERHTVSPDGGTITIASRKSSVERNGDGDWIVPGNADRILRILESHTPIKHYMTAAPYVRLYGRMARAIREAVYAKRFNNGKILLDSIYARR